MSNINEIVDPPLPTGIGEAKLKLVGKTLIEGDPKEGIEPFYAYDLENSESGMVGSIDLYVSINPQSTAQFHELQVGQLFKLVPAK